MNTGSGFQGLDSLTEHAILLFSVLNRVSCTWYFVLPTVFFAKKNISMMQEPLLHDVSLKNYLYYLIILYAKRSESGS